MNSDSYFTQAYKPESQDLGGNKESISYLNVTQQGILTDFILY